MSGRQPWERKRVQRGLPTRAADEGDGLPLRVSAIAQCEFLEYAAEAMNDSAFGLRLAGQIDPRDVGMYFYADFGSSRPRRSARTLFALLPDRKRGVSPDPKIS